MSCLRPLPSRQGRPIVIAHRGASGERPENTLPAYELALAQRADAIEIDLHATRDGTIVVTHDAEIPGLSDASEVCEASLADLRRLDVGGGERIPTLAEVLDGFGGRIALNLEVKGTRRGRRYPGMEAAALAAVEGRGLLDSTLFSSFDDAVLEELRRISGTVRLGVLVSSRTPPAPPARALERARAVAAEAIHPHRLMVDEILVEAAHGEGIAVYVYTVDAAAEMERLLDLGVDGIFTNYPARLRAVVDRRVESRGVGGATGG